MSDDLFERVDAYIDGLFAPGDAVLDGAVARARAAGMPEIQISAGQGKFLYLLARLVGARRILELGTLAGYSTIWLARALPADGPNPGKLVTMEYSAAHAAVARLNFEAASLADRIEVIVGAALESLPKLAARSEPLFDMVFIDADKNNYPAYLNLVVPMTRPGGLILADNVIRGGRVLDTGATDAYVLGAAAFNKQLAADQRLEAIVLQQVGVKGHDGIAVVRVR